MVAPDCEEPDRVGSPSITPEQNLISLKLEDEIARWRNALKTQRYAPLRKDLEKIYKGILDGRKIKELQRKEHPVFPGFTPYGTSEDNLLAYRCGYEKTILAGSPDIVESDIQRHINFNCRSCKATMYSEEAGTNFRDD